MTTDQPADFPNVTFFRRLCTLAAADVELFEKDGYYDSVVALRMLSDDAAGRLESSCCGSSTSCAEVRALSDAKGRSSPRRARSISRWRGPLEVWREMIDNIQAHGGAGSRHTLNTLALPGVAPAACGDRPRERG